MSLRNYALYLEQHLKDCFEIITIDDCSTDDTLNKLQSLSGIRVIHHPINRGYGASIKSGIKQAKGEFVATFDGDGQHYPADLVALCRSVEQEEWDMVVGARSRIFHSKLWRLPGKWFLGWLANYLSKRRIPDLNSAYASFAGKSSGAICTYARIDSLFPPPVRLSSLIAVYNIAFRPIEVRSRQGKSTVSLMTGYETILLILRVICLFEPLRIFIPASIILTLAGLIHAIYPFLCPQTRFDYGVTPYYYGGNINLFLRITGRSNFRLTEREI